MTAWFPLRYDTTTKVVSGAFCVIMLAVAWMVHAVAVGAIAIVIVLLGYAWSPRGYLVSDDAVVVKRLIGDVKIPLAESLAAKARNALRARAERAAEAEAGKALRQFCATHVCSNGP